MIKEVVDTRKDNVRKTGMVYADDIELGATFLTSPGYLMLKKDNNTIICLDEGEAGVYTRNIDRFDIRFDIREYVDIRIEIV